jgi:hypothetical protein
MNPPIHAVAVSIDEKSQIQALDRTQPGLPIMPGKCGTMTHDKRNRTTTLFAALDVLEGRSSASAWRVTGIRNSSAFSARSTARPRPGGNSI